MKIHQFTNEETQNHLIKLQAVVGGNINGNLLEVDNEIGKGSIQIYTDKNVLFAYGDVDLFSSIQLELFHFSKYDYTLNFFGKELIYYQREEDSIHLSTPSGFFLFKDMNSIFFDFKKGEKVKYTTIYFNHDFANKETQSYLDKLDRFFFHRGDANLENWKNSVFNSSLIQQPFMENWKALKFQELFLLFENLIRNIDTTEEKKLYSDYEVDIAFNIRDRMRNNLKEKPVVSELAKEFGINQRKLGELFKHLFQQPIYNYYNQERVHVIKEELRSTHKSLMDIASEYAFTDVNHMSKTFKTYFGVTPSKFRNEKHEEGGLKK